MCIGCVRPTDPTEEQLHGVLASARRCIPSCMFRTRGGIFAMVRDHCIHRSIRHRLLGFHDGVFTLSIHRRHPSRRVGRTYIALLSHRDSPVLRLRPCGGLGPDVWCGALGHCHGLLLLSVWILSSFPRCVCPRVCVWLGGFGRGSRVGSVAFVELVPHVRVEPRQWTVGIRPLPRRARIEIDGGEATGGGTCTVDWIVGRPAGGGCA